jgi:hypothetical protein
VYGVVCAQGHMLELASSSPVSISSMLPAVLRGTVPPITMSRGACLGSGEIGARIVAYVYLLREVDSSHTVVMQTALHQCAIAPLQVLLVGLKQRAHHHTSVCTQWLLLCCILAECNKDHAARAWHPMFASVGC